MKWFLLTLTVLLIIAHQDFWNWDKIDPLGDFLPVGLWYHMAFCIAGAILMGLFVLSAWPKHLEDAEPETDEARKAEGSGGH